MSEFKRETRLLDKSTFEKDLRNAEAEYFEFPERFDLARTWDAAAKWTREYTKKEYLKAGYSGGTVLELEQENSELKAKLAKAVKALEFYADYHGNTEWGEYILKQEFGDIDAGSTAEETLAAIEAKE